MAKEIIRHLEFYGFPDQNKFMSESNIDSSIDRKQDWEIHKIGRDLYDFRHFQRGFNNMTVKINTEQTDAINDLFKDVDKIENKVGKNRFDIDRLSIGARELDVKVNDISGNVETISGDVKTIASEVDVINNEIYGESGINYNISVLYELIGGGGSTPIGDQIREISGKVEDISGYVETISGKVDNTYTKEEVYTKQEVDGLISGGTAGMATQEWVEDNFYKKDEVYTKNETSSSTEIADALSNYYKKNETSGSTELDEAFGQVYKKNETSGKSELHDAFEGVDDKIEALEDKHDREINGINIEITNIKNDVANKADKTETETAIIRLDNKIDNLSSSTQTKLDSKVDQSVFNEYTGGVYTNINIINGELTRKADKVYIDTTVKGWVDDEKARAEAAESALGARIDGNGTRMTNIESVNTRQDNDLDTLTHRIADEEANRATEDAKLLGNEDTDTHDSKTIWGARKYAEEMKADAISTARTYTDSQITIIRNNDLAAERAYVDSSLSTKADKTYVNAQDTQLDNKIDNNYNLLHQYTDTAVGDEKTERQAADTAMDADIRALNTQVGDLNTKVNEISNVGHTGELNKVHEALHDLIDWMKVNVQDFPQDFHPEI